MRVCAAPRLCDSGACRIIISIMAHHDTGQCSGANFSDDTEITDESNSEIPYMKCVDNGKKDIVYTQVNYNEAIDPLLTSPGSSAAFRATCVTIDDLGTKNSKFVSDNGKPGGICSVYVGGGSSSDTPDCITHLVSQNSSHISVPIAECLPTFIDPPAISKQSVYKSGSVHFNDYENLEESSSISEMKPISHNLGYDFNSDASSVDRSFQLDSVNGDKIAIIPRAPYDKEYRDKSCVAPELMMSCATSAADATPSDPYSGRRSPGRPVAVWPTESSAQPKASSPVRVNNGKVMDACDRMNLLLSQKGALDETDHQVNKVKGTDKVNSGASYIKNDFPIEKKDREIFVTIRSYEDRDISRNIFTPNGKNIDSSEAKTNCKENVPEMYEKCISERTIANDLSIGNESSATKINQNCKNQSFYDNVSQSPCDTEVRKPSELHSPMKSCSALPSTANKSVSLLNDYEVTDTTGSKARKEQSVEDLLAAVKQFDQTVDDLCEMSNITGLADSVPLDELFNSPPCRKTNQEIVTNVVQPSCVNPMLREFSAIHELCQGATPSRFKPIESENLIDEIIAPTTSKEIPTIISGLHDTVNNAEQNNGLLKIETKEIVTDKESYTDLVHEAINKNCNFASLENGKLGSMKRSISQDTDDAIDLNSESYSVYKDFLEHDNAKEILLDSPKRAKTCESAPYEASAESVDDSGLVSAVTSVVRRSFRRVKRLRNSFGRSKRRGDREVRSEERINSEYLGGERRGSEEIGERRYLPSDPNFGLPSVRSPSTSALLLPSIVASLDNGGSMLLRAVDPAVPRIPEPRETLTPPSSSPRIRWVQGACSWLISDESFMYRYKCSV